MKKALFSLALILSFNICSCHNEKENTVEEIKEKESSETKENKETDIIVLDQKAIKLADFNTETVKEKSFQEVITTTGNIKETENSIFKVTSLASGKILSENIEIGQRVSKGQTLALIQNAEVVKIHGEYIHELHNNEILVRQAQIKLELAKANLDREENLLKQGISAKKDYLQAKTEYDLNKSEIEGLKEHRTHIRSEAQALLANYNVKLPSGESEVIQSNSPVISPKSGVVTKKSIVAGNIISPDITMYEISDLSKVYLEISIYGKDINKIKLGEQVTFNPDTSSNSFIGKIDFINNNTNPESQTFTARATLKNESNILKPGLFGKVSIKSNEGYSKLFVPEKALQSYGKENFVFIALGDNKYKKSVVSLDKKVDDGFLINKGINKGDKIVVNGSFILKSETLKSQFAEEE